MPIPAVTALYGSLNAVLNVALATVVVLARRRDGVSVGAGESKALLVAIRTHANNAEYVPLALVLLLLVELCGGASLWLHVCGGVLLVARVSHAIGMPRPAPNVFRVFGVAATWCLILAMAAWALWLRRGA